MNIETKYNIGDTVFYIDRSTSKIVSGKITEIKVCCTPYYNGEVDYEIICIVKNNNLKQELLYSSLEELLETLKQDYLKQQELESLLTF